MIVLTGSGQCVDQGLPSRAEVQEFCLKSTTTNNNVATSSKMYFFFCTLHQKNPEKEQPWPVLECHWMSSKWPSLALWERSARCLHWWVGTDGFMLMFTQTAAHLSYWPGSQPVLSAIHQHPDRTEERCFVPYKPPPEDGSPADVEEFLEHARFITEDLEWLLALSHDKFWCQVQSCQRVM